MPENNFSLMEMMITLTQVSRSYKAVCDRLAAQFGLTQAIAWPIVAINRLGGGVRPGEVAGAVGIEPSSVVRLIDQLVAFGLIERRDDTNDRRAKQLFLTETGRAKANEIEMALAPLRRQFLHNVTRKELDTCMAVFRKIGGSIEKHKADLKQA